MKKDNLLQNPYLLFSPFLLVYILYVLIFSPDNLASGDSIRYLSYATNLINGFYSPPAPNIMLRNGPGYPMVLIPFLILKLPLINIALMNAVFHYFSIILLFKALREIVSLKVTLIFSFAWACYYIAFQNMTYILTETFTYLLISLLIYSITKAFKQKTSKSAIKYIILSGMTMGYTVLTKMIFGHVLLFMLIGIGILWIINRRNQYYRKLSLMILIAFLTTAPYLIYTYNLTNRVFYWGMGSDTLYWMSNPNQNEYGDFKYGLNQNAIELGNYNIPGVDSILRANHEKNLVEIDKYTGLGWDDEYKRIAIRNIKEHPMKYAENVVYNIGRLVFHYPFSYAVQRPKTLLIFPVNGILLTMILFCLIPTLLNWRKIPIAVKFLVIFSFLYLGASSLITAYVRMFTIIVPILLFWFAFIVENTIKINLQFKNKSDSSI